MFELCNRRGHRSSELRPIPRCGFHILTVAVLAMFGLLAWALGVNAQETETVQGCSSLNVRALMLNDGWVLMRDDGKILTAETYCGGDEVSDDLFLFYLCGAKGWTYLAADGAEVLTIRSRLSAGAFSEGLAAVEKKVNQWGYMDRAGNLVIPARFVFAEPFSEGLAAVYLHKHWQYIDRSGKTVLTPRMAGKRLDFVSEFKHGATLVGFVGRHRAVTYRGLMDHSGQWIVKPTPNLEGELDNGMALLYSGDKVGFVDSAGHATIPPEFSGVSLLPFQEGLAAVYIEKDGELRAGFINLDGKWAIPARFEGALHFCGGLAPVKMAGSWGYIDRSGKTVIDPKFEDAQSFNAGTAVVLEREPDGNLHRKVIDRGGRVLYRSPSNTEIIRLD